MEWIEWAGQVEQVELGAEQLGWPERIERQQALTIGLTERVG